MNLATHEFITAASSAFWKRGLEKLSVVLTAGP